MVARSSEVPLSVPFEATRPAGVGAGNVVVRCRDGASILERAHATSPLRFVRPTFPGASAVAVCLVTFGGGLVDGDAIDVDLHVDRGATLVVFTQSSTKVFRGRARQNVRAHVEGTLVLLADPVAAFADAHYTQRVDVTVAGEGSCVLLDGFTSGRAAFGERWAMGGLDLATSLRRTSDELGPSLVARDALRLDAADGSIADRMAQFEASLSIIAYGPRVAPVIAGILGCPAVPEASSSRGRSSGRESDDHVVVASPIPSTRSMRPQPPADGGARADVPARAEPRPDATLGAVARVFSSSPARALSEARRRLRNLPDIQVVDPFASRY